MPVRSTIALLALLLALALPVSALAQGAGDQEYNDPFSGQATPTATAKPAPAQPAQPAPAAVQGQATPVPTAAPAAATPVPAAAPVPTSARRQLPYTGADAGLLALAGALCLAAGLAVRARLRADG